MMRGDVSVVRRPLSSLYLSVAAAYAASHSTATLLETVPRSVFSVSQ